MSPELIEQSSARGARPLSPTSAPSHLANRDGGAHRGRLLASRSFGSATRRRESPRRSRPCHRPGQGSEESQHQLAGQRLGLHHQRSRRHRHQSSRRRGRHQVRWHRADSVRPTGARARAGSRAQDSGEHEECVAGRAPGDFSEAAAGEGAMVRRNEGPRRSRVRRPESRDAAAAGCERPGQAGRPGSRARLPGHQRFHGGGRLRHDDAERGRGIEQAGTTTRRAWACIRSARMFATA